MSGTTYSQRVTVKEITVEELHKSVETWLRSSSCTIQESKPLGRIKAYFPANNPMVDLGLRDVYPKNIEVSIGSFGSSAIMNITFTQELLKMGEAGFLYWGSRLEKLYLKLGVSLDPYTLTQLYPPRMVQRVIQRALKLYAAFMLLSLIIIVLGLDLDPDLVAFYTLMVVLPGTFVAGLDINDHRQLLIKIKYK